MGCCCEVWPLAEYFNVNGDPSVLVDQEEVFIQEVGGIIGAIIFQFGVDL